jgi:predicted phage terminase large subunit-like protein
MDLRRIAISKLKPAPYNPCVELKPGDPVFEQLRRSIETFGVVEPIVWNRRSGHVVGGHQRFAVLTVLGHTHAEVVVVNLPAEREKALNLALNKIVGSWDEQKLAALLGELGALPEFDLSVTGFENDEIAALIDRVEAAAGALGDDACFDAEGALDTSRPAVTKPPDETITRILEYARKYELTDFGIEANQFQKLMVDNLRSRADQRNVRMPINPITNRSGKQQRIAALESEVSQGRIVFARRHLLFMEQLRSFPLGKHDDGPDALEMAVSTITEANHWSVSCMVTGRVSYDSRYGGPPPGSWYR